MNRTPLARRTQVINALVEGNSIRSAERMTNTHRDTIMRLLVQVGAGCEKLLDERMRGLSCRRVQIDEIWTFVAKKQRQVKEGDDRSRVGDQWTFVALDADTKLVPAYRIGKRNLPTATAFLNDLSDRLANRVQLSSDALAAYVEATEQAFGADIDYGQVVKAYEAEPIGPGRYSPPRVVSAERSVVAGSPDPDHISTSFVERQNSLCGCPCAGLPGLRTRSARRSRTYRRPWRCTLPTTIRPHPLQAADDAGYGGGRDRSPVELGGVGRTHFALRLHHAP